MKKMIFLVAGLLILLMSRTVFAELHGDLEVSQFIDEMVSKHGFEKQELDAVFSEARVSSTILDAISRPAEAMPWYKYRNIFLRNDRIQLGQKFIKEHEALLQRAYDVYGVPPEIIAAIIGVETRYGSHKGSYRVIDSLVTLGFRYPKRASFFRRELEQFLLLARDEGLDPLKVTGSYAGAMGIPQFISSSFRHYAVDFDDDGHIDIWENPADAIGSVANYFKVHGWKRDQSVAFPATVSGTGFQSVLTSSLEPEKTVAEILGSGVSIERTAPPEANAKLLEYEQENGNEYWLGLQNFYVITRYNHSALYAMAVYQLSQEIAAADSR